MYAFLDINNIFITLIGYQMSYIEFFGTVFNLWCVWLASKNRILSWPIGLIGVVLFMSLFWQIQLYSDFLEQIYFLFTGFWGWWVWSHGKKTPEGELAVTRTSWSGRYLSIGVIIVGTIALGFLTSNLHVYLAQYFPLPASFPYLDAFTTILSFVATVLLVKRKVDAWYLWITVDVIGIWLYWVKDVHLVSLLYLLFLIIAIRGLLKWTRIVNSKLLRI